MRHYARDAENNQITIMDRTMAAYAPLFSRCIVARLRASPTSLRSYPAIDGQVDNLSNRNSVLVQFVAHAQTRRDRPWINPVAYVGYKVGKKEEIMYKENHPVACIIAL